jgi:SAM-dependent methyltransferase
MMFGTREEFAYAICPDCGSASIVEVPSDLARHYPSGYYARRDAPADSPVRGWRRRLVRWRTRPRLFGPGRGRLGRRLDRALSALVPLPKGHTSIAAFVAAAGLRTFDDPVLDVGCGTWPTRLVALQDVGFERLLGIDPFVAGDARPHGIPVLKRGVEAVDGSFALITFHHSLEHTAAPLDSLRAARARLREGGRILVRLPLMGSELWDRYGTDWVELDAPRHLAIPTLHGFRELATRAGLDVIDIEPESSDWEFIGSEQYRRDIALNEPGSWFVEPSAAPFDDAQLEGFRTAARALGRSERAGRAGIWLEVAGGDQRRPR